MDPNCWDFFKCSQEDKEKCPAYLKDQGKHCWLVATENTDIVNSGVSVYYGVKHCFECKYFIARHNIETYGG